MKWKAAVLTAVFSGVVGAALAQGGGFEEMFGADANGDGAISLAEVQSARARTFARLDANDDGFISAAERDVAAQGHGARMMAHGDSNNDGRLSRDEFLNRPMRGFDHFDANNNDVLEPSEIEAARAAMQNFGGRRTGG